MTAYVVDTETTGHGDSQPDYQVIELAVGRILVRDEPPGLAMETHFSGRFKPAVEMQWGALATHHILPEELADCPPSDLAKAHLPTDMEYMIGHKVDHDWEALGRPACKRICTLAMARYYWPQLDSHSLSALMYMLSRDHQATRTMLKAAHGAEADCMFALTVLQHIITARALDGWEAVWAYSENARIPRVWTFGKHKGKEIAKTDRGYLSWCVHKADDLDPYVKEAARRALAGELQP